MDAKRLAAEKAVTYITDGMVVGLGTGSTAYWAIQKIGERVRGGLNIKAVASSKKSEDLAKEAGISIVPFSTISSIDVTVDGADEVDKNHNLIKGGGGALVREKILASNSQKFIVVVDESKLVTQLGKFPLPVEVLPFAVNLVIDKLKGLGCLPVIRQASGHDYITDNGNLIADCHFQKIEDPAALNTQINLLPGVVDCGLFVGVMVHAVIVGYTNGRVMEL